MESLPFEELAAFIRDWAQVPVEQPIGPDTRFEDDLGITGDDGGALLQAVAKRFTVQLTIEDGYRKTLGLGKNEYLFNSEGFAFWELLPFVSVSTVRTFTVGDLHDAMIAVTGQSA
jgi:hypothetical protein